MNFSFLRRARNFFIDLIRKILMPQLTSEFDKQVEILEQFLKSCQKNPMELDERMSLWEIFSDGMTAFDLAEALWEYRFTIYLRKVLSLIDNASFSEIEAICREFYRKGQPAEEVAKAYKARVIERRKKATPPV